MAIEVSGIQVFKCCGYAPCSHCGGPCGSHCNPLPRCPRCGAKPKVRGEQVYYKSAELKEIESRYKA